MFCFINGNRIEIPADASIGSIVLHLCKEAKISTISQNQDPINRFNFDEIISQGDQFDIRLKSKPEQLAEKVGARTLIQNHLRKAFRSSKQNIGAILTPKPEIETIIYKGSSIKFYSPTDRIRRRAMFAQKEHDTMAWISTLARDDVLWDIGANIGAVSLYAASLYDSKVISLEPYHPNHSILTTNIRINKLSDKILALNLAATNQNRLGSFFVQNESAGDSGNSFDKPIDNTGVNYPYAFSQQTLGCSIDDLINSYHLPPPTHLKIDVDGFDLLVLEGAHNTLRQNSIVSISVEIDLIRPNAKEDISGLLSKYGYKLTSVAGEVLPTPYNLPKIHGDCLNYIFELDV